MANLREFEHLIIKNNTQQNCEAFVFSGKDKTGEIFGIAEVISKEKTENQKLILFILNELENLYFNSPENQNENCIIPEKYFENLLKLLNGKIAALIETGEVSLLNKNINFVICMLSPYNDLKNNGIDLYISQVGQPLAFLIHTAKQKTHMIDIFAGAENPKINPVKFFSNVISGRIFFNDSLFITTKNIFNYFTLEKIKSLVSNFDIKQACAKLSGTIKQIPTKENFASVFFKAHIPKNEFDEQIIPKSQASIEKLISTEEETEKIMVPSFSLNIKKTIGSLANALGSNKTKARESYSIGSMQNNKTGSLGIFQKILKIFAFIFAFIKNIFVFIFLFFKKLFYFIINKDGYRKESLENLKTGFSSVPKVSKILLVFGVIFAIVFIQSLIWLKNKQEIKKENEAYNKLIAQIDQTINEAESSLIYKDENKALLLVMDAQDNISRMVFATPERQAQKETELAKLKTLQNKIYHINNIENPKVLVDFASELPNIAVGKIILLGDKLIGYKTSDQKIYHYNITDSVQSKYDAMNSDTMLSAIEEKDALLFLHSQNKLSEYSLKTNEAKSLDLALTNGELKDAVLYNNKLYGISPSDSQIYKLSKSGSGYGSSSAWLKNNIDLSQAVSMAIDGNIYVLNSNGKVYKFLSGSQESFILEKIEPQFEAAEKIYTNLDSSKIYILEPKNKRLAIFNKAGQLISQYTSEKFDKLTDMAVDDKGNKVYLMNGSVVFEIGI